MCNSIFRFQFGLFTLLSFESIVIVTARKLPNINIRISRDLIEILGFLWRFSFFCTFCSKRTLCETVFLFSVEPKKKKESFDLYVLLLCRIATQMAFPFSQSKPRRTAPIIIPWPGKPFQSSNTRHFSLMVLLFLPDWVYLNAFLYKTEENIRVYKTTLIFKTFYSSLSCVNSLQLYSTQYHGKVKRFLSKWQCFYDSN